ncbi:MAG: hypothetical protein KDI73_13015, partial [Candidatus Competibacteraceae bacterium]|nr:hypothetical protein [Candidatus Competibacteraceae bacterium]
MIGARVERHSARSGPAARRGTVKVPSVVAGGRDASTGRRSRPEGVTFQRGFDGATRREPEVGNSRPVRRRAAPTNGRLQNWE